MGLFPLLLRIKLRNQTINVVGCIFGPIHSNPRFGVREKEKRFEEWKGAGRVRNAAHHIRDETASTLIIYSRMILKNTVVKELRSNPTCEKILVVRRWI